MFRNIQEVKRANDRAGHTWFSPGNMSMFGTRIVSKVITSPSSRQFFITRDCPDPDLAQPAYTVREAKPDGKVETYGLLCDYRSTREALDTIARVR